MWEIQNGIWREKLFGNPGHEPVGSLPVNQLGLERPGKTWKGIEMTGNSLVERYGKSMNRKVRKVLETTRNILNLKKEKLLVKSTISESFQVRKKNVQKRSERFIEIANGNLEILDLKNLELKKFFTLQKARLTDAPKLGSQAPLSRLSERR